MRDKTKHEARDKALLAVRAEVAGLEAAQAHIDAPPETLGQEYAREQQQKVWVALARAWDEGYNAPPVSVNPYLVKIEEN